MSWCVQNNDSSTGVLGSRKVQGFVTVLEVTSKHHTEHQDYVTVLQVDSNNGATEEEVVKKDTDDEEEVTIYRLPGERLGMGLKFDGGVQVSETINQLFIQSITPESPASRAKCRWGMLQDGDKILQIERKDITTMTRLDCVSALREAPVALKILVQHGGQSRNNVLMADSKKDGRSQPGENEISPAISTSLMNGHSDREGKLTTFSPPSHLQLLSNPLTMTTTTTMGRSTESSEINHQTNNGHVCNGTTEVFASSSSSSAIIISPPPVPARKLRSIRLSPQMERALKLAQEKYPNGDVNGEVVIVSSPGPWRSSNRILETMEELPVEADIYMDLIAEEDQMLNEYESDETGSSISTVIDRCSISSTCSSKFSESSPNTMDHLTFDLAQALSPFEQLERELESDFNLPSIANLDNLLPQHDRPPHLVRNQGSDSDPVNNTTLEPPENFKDHPGFMHVNDQNNNVCNAPKSRELANHDPELTNGFVTKERRKFENLVGKMAPTPTKGLPSRRRRKQPPPPPPPQASNSRMTEFNDTNVKTQANASSSLSKSIKSILKKKSPAPPVPPRQNKVVRRLFSNSDSTSQSSAASSDNVPANDRNLQQKKSPDAAENRCLEDNVFDLLSSRLGVSQSESPDCSRRLQAVQSWLEASVLLPAPASAEHSPQLERSSSNSHASELDNSRHSNVENEIFDAVVVVKTPYVQETSSPTPRPPSTGPPSVMQEDLLPPSKPLDENKAITDEQQGGEAGLSEDGRASAAYVTDYVTGAAASAATPPPPVEQALPSSEEASRSEESVPPGCPTSPPNTETQPPASCHGVAVNPAGEEPKMAEHETSDTPLIDLHDFSPSLSRLPPDGHEFPPNFKDPLTANFLNNVSLLDLNDNSPPFKNSMVPQENGYLDPPSGFEDSGIGSTRESSLVDIVNSAVGNDFIVDDDDEMDKVPIACEVNGNEHRHEPNQGHFMPIAKLSDETSINSKEVLPLPPLVPSVISSEPSLPLVPSVTSSVLPRCGNLQYNATSPVPDETDSIDTLDSAVDCELHEPDLMESVSMYSRTSSANSQHLSELGQSGDEDTKIHKNEVYSNVMNGSTKHRYSNGDESKVDKTQLRLYERTVIRNVDEKNTMSLKEKIALFSQTETEPVPSPTRKTRPNKIEVAKPSIKSPDKQRSRSESRRESLNENVPNNNVQDVTAKRNNDLNAASKSGVMYRSLGNISNLSNSYHEEEYHNDTEELPQKNGFFHSTDELPSRHINGDSSSRRVEEKKETFASSYGTLPRRSNASVASATKRYSVGSLSLNHTEQRSSSTTSLYSLLESRRQQVSKLRGLIIPEKPENKQMPLAPKNLPLPIIKSTDSVLNGKPRKLSPDKFSSLPRGFDFSSHSVETVVDGDAKLSSNVVLTSPPWKGNTTDLPKYSPAFKRKQLSAVQGNGAENGHGRPLISPNSRETKSKIWDSYQVHTQSNATHWASSNSVETKSSEPVSLTSRPVFSSLQRNNISSNKSLSLKRINVTVDNSSSLPINNEETFDSEDRDSVISSAGSYLSPSLSPPLSPRDGENSHSPVLSCRSPKLDRCLIEDGMVEEYIVVRVPDISAPTVIGANMKLNQGQKPKQKVVRSDSVEAINRWNVLKQAKHSRGGFEDGGSMIFNDQDLLTDNKTNIENEDQLDGYTPSVSPLMKEEHKSSITPEAISTDVCSEERLTNNACEKDEKPDHNISVKSVSAERWSQLEKKYGNANNENNSDTVVAKPPSTSRVSYKEQAEKVEPSEPVIDPDLKPRRLSQQKTVLSCSGNNPSEDSAKTFKALAEKWEQRAHDAPAVPISAPPARRCSLPPSLALVSNKQDSRRSSVEKNTAGMPDFIPSRIETCNEDSELLKDVPIVSSLPIPDKPVERKRPKSGSELANAVTETNPIHKRSSSKDLLDIMNGSKTKNTTSVSDIRRSFESQMSNGSTCSQTNGHTTEEPPMRRDYSRNNSISVIPNHARMSSLDSTASDSDFSTPAHYGSVTSLTSNARDQFGSITSLASSTSIISPQGILHACPVCNNCDEPITVRNVLVDCPVCHLARVLPDDLAQQLSDCSMQLRKELQQLIDEANQSLEESGTPQHEISVVVLHREMASGSIGITLAGGADYESKEITVHKVINGSLADRDGRILKGDRVLSINGKNMKGVTHKDALNILKAPRPECVLVLSRNTSGGTSDEPGSNPPRVFISRNSVVKPEVPPSSINVPSHTKSPSQDMSASGKVITTQIMKDAGGLGFSLEGGKDSPIGDRPLSIKKIFQGGAAEKNGILKIGDEIVSVNSVDVTNMARIEAWNFMKKQPDGVMTIALRHV